MFPRSHGLWRNGQKLDTGRPVLAEVLRYYGYATAGYVNSSIVGREMMFHRGFDTFRIERNYAQRHWRWGGEELFDVGINWMQKRQEPFFLWLHCEYPHASYNPPPPYNRQFGEGPDKVLHWLSQKTADQLYAQGNWPAAAERETLSSLYDGEVAFADAGFGRVLDALAESGQLENSIVVLTADHGESLFDRRGISGHRGKFYDNVLHVPLILKLPGNEPGGISVDSLVQSVDLFPTLLELAGIDVPAGLDGKSLLPAVSGETPVIRDEIFAEFLFAEPKKYGGPVVAVRTDRWKLILRSNGDDELYDLESDPGERTNLADTRPDDLAHCANRIRRWDAAHPRDERGERGLVISDELRRVLEEAGYLGEEEDVAQPAPSK